MQNLGENACGVLFLLLGIAAALHAWGEARTGRVTLHDPEETPRAG